MLRVEKAGWAQKKLALHVNDNVYKNIESSFSVVSFDPKSVAHKEPFNPDEKAQLVDALLKEGADV